MAEITFLCLKKSEEKNNRWLNWGGGGGGGGGGIGKAKVLAVSPALRATFWPVISLRHKNFWQFWILNRGDLNICIYCPRRQVVIWQKLKRECLDCFFALVFVSMFLNILIVLIPSTVCEAANEAVDVYFLFFTSLAL